MNYLLITLSITYSCPPFLSSLPTVAKDFLCSKSYNIVYENHTRKQYAINRAAGIYKILEVSNVKEVKTKTIVVEDK